MSEEAAPRCRACAGVLPAGRLDCPQCHALVHAEALARLAGEAAAAESRGDAPAARVAWREALTLLPADTVQAQRIRARLDATTDAVTDATTDAPPARASNAGRAAGALGVAGVLLLKLKSVLFALFANAKLLLLGLTKIPTLLSMGLWASLISGRDGWGLGLGVLASIYVHEIGHVAALRRLGIPATAPMFIPGFGAVVRLGAYPMTPREDAAVGLAGPRWGLGAAIAAGVYGALAASPTARAVAGLGAAINLFNLVPVWQLDGARGARPLSRSQRRSLAALALVGALLAASWMSAAVGVVMAARAPTPEGTAGDAPTFRRFAALIVGLDLVILLTR